MAKETLSIPEEKLAEVIKVIKIGLEYVDGNFISEETRENLIQWCDDEEEYLKRISEDI